MTHTPDTLITAAVQRLAAVLQDNAGNRITGALIDGMCTHVDVQLRQAFAQPAPQGEVPPAVPTPPAP